ncbi:MAG: TraB family protein [Acidobacteria bacterium]|nr:MAG: TraB family protein [Acidobacteriota bacterium]REK00487.1 MAG: TraB family protein [Acidobacteriota bacterium]
MNQIPRPEADASVAAPRSDAPAPQTGAEQQRRLPATLEELRLPDGRTLYLLGTAHVSQASVDDVRAACDLLRPDSICVELCAARHRNIQDPAAWKQLDIFKVLREGNAPLLLSSLVMTAFQRRIARELGVQPGAEMIEGIRQAEALAVPLVLADRDIQVTLRRTWRNLGFWSRLKLLSQLIGSVFVSESISAEDVERLKQGAELEGMLAEMAKAFPQVKKPLIDERDAYLAHEIAAAPGESVLAIVGAGHAPGIRRLLGEPIDIEALQRVPPASPWPKILQWAIPIAIIGLLVYGFFRGGLEESLASAGLWVLINGLLAAIGAAAALGHPLTVISAFVAAPLTSLNPMIAAGWVSGLVQAWVKRPRVDDLEQLPEDITTVSGFWRNPVSRVLLVVVLSNVGSMLGTFLAGTLIAARTL